MKRIKAVHRWLPVAGVILFFIVVGNAAETTVSSILANPAQFDGKTVTIQGTATAVKETTCRRRNSVLYRSRQCSRDHGLIDTCKPGPVRRENRHNPRNSHSGKRNNLARRQ